MIIILYDVDVGSKSRLFHTCTERGLIDKTGEMLAILIEALHHSPKIDI
jgi:hypothetical protein